MTFRKPVIDQEIISRRFNAFAREKKNLCTVSDFTTKRVAVFLFWEYGLILNYFEDEKITIFSFRRL